MFAQRLRELRRSHNLTQLQLSEKIGTAKSTIAGYEKGVRKPKMAALNGIAQLFNTSADYLIGLTDDKTPKEPSKDLAKVLQAEDFHYKGKKLTNEDLDILISYLERVSKLDNDDLKNTSRNTHNNNINTDNNNDVKINMKLM